MKEVELLVACGHDKVVAHGRLVGALGAEWRVREDDVEALTARLFVDRVAQGDVRLHLVEVHVHEGEPARPRD